MNQHVQYLLVGAGVASAAAAEAIRQRDANGSICLVGQENSRPYHRGPLSKEFLRRQMSREQLSVHGPQWYADQHVTLRTGRRAAQIDTVRHGVMLDNGEELSYSHLLLATGAASRPLTIPGAQLPNLFSIRTLEDVDRLHHAIDKALREGRQHARGRGWATVFGGSLLGTEIAASLTQMGLAVDLVCGQSNLLDPYLGEVAGKVLTRQIERNGVRVHLNDRARKLEGDGRIQRVALESGGMIQCDLVVAAVGVSAMKDLLRNAPVAAEKAILTDAQCRTNVEDIFAAGDCAAMFDPLFGKHRLLAGWDAARQTGAIAGANMAGASEIFSGPTYVGAQAFDVKVHCWGEPKLVSHRLQRGPVGGDKPDCIELGIGADGRVAHVAAIGSAADHATCAALMAQRVAINGNSEIVKDPAAKLESLLEA